MRVRLEDVNPGDTLVCDGGFTCMGPGQRTVERDADGLFIRCNNGEHYLEGEVGCDGYLIGLTRETKP